ncbi:cupin domain-containing protein [Streptomyces sp. Je 1-332]|uniref:cupin domain-containing protein n=1 Tax=Streptomyces sp. Je 1-332 TaxID=3231270 RepID=UPI003458D317
MTAFADLIAPHGADNFLRTVWGREMKLFRGATSRFAHLLPWPTLNGILHRHRLEAPRLRIAQAGQLVPPDSYGTPPGSGDPYFRIDPHKLNQRLADGATLVLDGIDELHAPIEQLAADIEHVVRERVQVNCYASFGPQPAFDTHWDDHEVLVLQVHGRKRWRVFAPTRPHPTRRDTQPPQQPVDEPVADLILTPGDVLHVPRGWWHDATAVDEPSLHLTFGVTPPTGVDLLTWAADQLRHHELARQNLPVHNDVEAQSQYVKELTALLTEQLDAGTILPRYRAARDAQAPSRAHPSLPWSATSGVPDDIELTIQWRAPRARLQVHAQAVRLTANGQLYTFASRATPVLQALLDGRARTVSELVSVPDNTLDRTMTRALCSSLINQGLASAEPEGLHLGDG